MPAGLMCVPLRHLRPVLRWAAVMALCLSAAPLAAQYSGRSLPPRALLARYGLERAWQNQATLNVRSDVVRHLVADEEVVIIQSRSGLLTVFDAQSGSKLWDGQIARADQYSFPAVTNANVLLIALGSTVYARDKYNGEPLWELRLPNSPNTQPEADDNRMYVGMVDGSCYAFNLGKIRGLQTTGDLRQYAYRTIDWRYRTSKPIVTPPVSNGTTVCFASETGNLYAVSARTRLLDFQFETDKPVAAPLNLFGSDLFFAGQDNNFYCLRIANGTTRWEYVTGRPVVDKPQVIGDSVYLLPIKSGMYRLTIDSGRPLWWAPEARAFVAASPNRIYVSSASDDILILDKPTGGVLGSLPLAGYPIRFANDRTDRLYIATESGGLVCLRETGANIPVYHRFPNRRPILPVFGDDAEAEPATEESPAQ